MGGGYKSIDPYKILAKHFLFLHPHLVGRWVFRRRADRQSMGENLNFQQPPRRPTRDQMSVVRCNPLGLIVYSQPHGFF